MADASTSGAQPTGDAGLVIPDDVKQKFGELIQLIIGSESMNTEERQYWVNILPIMTPEQLQNLREILVNEREQLKAIDQKYGQEIDKIGQEQAVRQFAAQRKESRTERMTQEASVRQEEASQMDDVLKQIDQF